MAIIRARDVALKALQKVGVVPPGQRSARDHHLAIALEWLSVYVGHLAATRRLEWLQRTWLIPLLVDEAVYDLREISSIPDSVNDARIISDWLACYRIWGNSVEELELLRQDEFRARTRVTGSGAPSMVWISRQPTPLLQVFPVAHVAGYTLRLVGSIDPAELASNAGETPLDVPPGWVLALALNVAALVSDGAVVRLDQNRRNTIKGEAARATDEIEVRADREHQAVEHVEPWGS